MKIYPQKVNKTILFYNLYVFISEYYSKCNLNDTIFKALNLIKVCLSLFLLRFS